jgi:hypothetical protein
MAPLAWVRFESPGYLALLAIIPLLIALSYRSLAGLGPWRRVLSVCLRCIVVLVAVLALAGAQRTQTVKDLSVIFLLDRSRSVPQDLQREAFKYVKQASGKLGTDDRLGVIAFDGVASVEQLPARSLDLDGITEPGAPDQTSLAAAARLALALLPSNATGRVVMVTDGNENSGDVLQEAQQYKAAGIPIDVVPLQY